MNDYPEAAFLIFILFAITIPPFIFYSWFKSYSVIEGKYLVNYRFFKKIIKKSPISEIKQLSVYFHKVGGGFSQVLRATLNDGDHIDLFSIDHLNSRDGARRYFINTLTIVPKLKKINPKIIITKGLLKYIDKYEIK